MATTRPSGASSGSEIAHTTPSPAARRDGRGTPIRAWTCCVSGSSLTTALSRTDATHTAPSLVLITADGNTGSGTLVVMRLDSGSMPSSASRALLEVAQTAPACAATAPQHSVHERVPASWMVAETSLASGSTREIEPSRSLGTQMAKLSPSRPAEGVACTGMTASTCPSASTGRGCPQAASRHRPSALSQATPLRLRADDGPVETADGRPRAIVGVLGEGVARGQRFVDVDAQPGLLVRPQHAVPNLGTTREDLARPLAEDMLLLDTEVVTGQVELQVGRVPNRRHVAGAVPRRAHAEELAQRRQLPGHAQTTDVRDVHADEVDQPIADQRHVFGLIDEQLAHGDRHRRLLAQDAEVLDVFRRERVLQEEQPVRLEVARQLDRLDRRHKLVHVVQQLDLLAEPTAQVLEQARHDEAVRTGLPRLLLGPQVGRLATGGRQDGRAVRRVARHGDLAADVAIALLDEAPGLVFHLGEVAPVRMRVQRRRFAALAAHELIDGHAGPFALDVPQRLVDAGQRVVQHRTAAPVGADVGGLIHILDVVHAAAEEERPEILLDGGDHGQRALREGGAAEAG